MTDSTAGLRHKIDRAGELQSVVRTMKALAASSIGQYEKSIRALSDYYRTVELGLSVCFRNVRLRGILGMPPSSAKDAKIGAVIFGSDQGLVGRFNERIADYALATIDALPAPVHHVWAVGERVKARLLDANLALTGSFVVPNSIQAVAPLVAQILIEAETRVGPNPITELHLLYNSPAQGASFEPVSQRLLPLDDQWRVKLANQTWPTRSVPEVMSDNTLTLRALIREYLFISLFRACCESLASESASRLAAMQRADKNIDELLEEVRSVFHRVRQSSIDEELFDVISGFEALSVDNGQESAADIREP